MTEVAEETVEEKEKPLTPQEKQELYKKKMEELREAGVDVNQPNQMMGMPSPMGMMGMAGMPGLQAGPMSSISPPSMVGAPPPPMPHRVDPADEVGPRRQQQEHPGIVRGKQQAGRATMTSDGLIQLDPIMMLEIELLGAEMRAAEAEEQLASRALRDARERQMALYRKQASLMHEITTQLGIEPGRSIRLVDKEQRLCRIEE